MRHFVWNPCVKIFLLWKLRSKLIKLSMILVIHWRVVVRKGEWNWIEISAQLLFQKKHFLSIHHCSPYRIDKIKSWGRKLVHYHNLFEATNENFNSPIVMLKSSLRLTKGASILDGCMGRQQWRHRIFQFSMESSKESELMTVCPIWIL